MTKIKSVEFKRLLADLHYWQERARIDARSLKGSRAKCRAIGSRLRAIQSDQRTRKVARSR